MIKIWNNDGGCRVITTAEAHNIVKTFESMDDDATVSVSEYNTYKMIKQILSHE